MEPRSALQPPAPPSTAVLVHPVAVKLPLRPVSDRMNVESAPTRPTKAGDGQRAAFVDRFPPPVSENIAAKEAAEGKLFDSEAPHSKSDDEVCDVFSRAARRLQAAAAVSSWLSLCSVVVDGRRCFRLLRVAAALAAGGSGSGGRGGVMRSPRWSGLPGRRWPHDSHATTAVMNTVELPRPFLDFAKMQVLRFYFFEHETKVLLVKLESLCILQR